MSLPSWLDALMLPNAPLRELAPGLLSALPESETGAAYDGRAALYDRVIGSSLYSRVVWGTTPARYRDFIEGALRSAQGPALDVAAGSCLESAALYPHCTQPLVVLDRSLDMLRRGMQRLRQHGPAAPERVVFLQADTCALPFRDAAFETLLCHGAFHVFPDVTPVCREWARVLQPGGGLHVSSLVTAGRRGDHFLRLLERAGELGPLRDAPAFQRELAAHFAASARVDCSGSFAFLSLPQSPVPS